MRRSRLRWGLGWALAVALAWVLWPAPDPEGSRQVPKIAEAAEAPRIQEATPRRASEENELRVRRRPVTRARGEARGSTASAPTSRARRLEVPAIGVSAPVTELGLKANRSLEVPKGYDETGWWSGGPAPGDRGPAVIVGHVDSKAGPGVFYRLRELDPGDRIRFKGRDGRRVTFAVQRTEHHSKNAFPTRRVYGRTPYAALRLITCAGSFDGASGHYRDNLIVFARRV